MYNKTRAHPIVYFVCLVSVLLRLHNKRRAHHLPPLVDIPREQESDQDVPADSPDRQNCPDLTRQNTVSPTDVERRKHNNCDVVDPHARWQPAPRLVHHCVEQDEVEHEARERCIVEANLPPEPVSKSPERGCGVKCRCEDAEPGGCNRERADQRRAADEQLRMREVLVNAPRREEHQRNDGNCRPTEDVPLGRSHNARGRERNEFLRIVSVIEVGRASSGVCEGRDDAQRPKNALGVLEDGLPNHPKVIVFNWKSCDC